MSDKRTGNGRARRSLWLCALALASLSLTFAAPARAITEAEFIAKVLGQDKLLEEAQIGLDIKQIELDASRDNYARWKVELSAGADYSKRDNYQHRTNKETGALYTRIYERKTKNATHDIGLDFDKRFLSSPGSFAFGINRDKEIIRDDRYNAEVFNEDRRYGGYTTALYAQFNFPLLKHDGNAESLKSYKRNIYDLEDQQLSFLETKEDFLNDRLDDFLEWVLHHTQAHINSESLVELRKLQPSDESEIALLDSAIAQTENALRDSQVQRDSIVGRLAVLLDDATLSSQTPQFDLHKRIELIDDARDYLAEHSRDLKRIDIDIQLNQIEIDYHQNRLLPELDLALRTDQFLNRAGTTTLNSHDEVTDHEISLTFSYPLGGSITTKAELAKRALSARRLEIIYAERMESIQGDLRRLASLLDFEEQRLLDAIAAAEQSTRLELANRTRGAPIRDLLQALRDERTARLDHIEALIDYQMRSIEYDNLLDRMITASAD